MEKIIASIIVAIIMGGGLWIYFERRDAAKVQEGVNKQVMADAAKANQNIATRRATDATFDKYDAADVCRQYDLTWVFADGKSHCE